MELHEDVTLLAADVGSWLNTSGLMMSVEGCRALLGVVNGMHAAFDKLLLKYKAFRCVGAHGRGEGMRRHRTAPCRGHGMCVHKHWAPCMSFACTPLLGL